MNVTLFSPHQDDEILSACLFINELKRRGDNVSIVFATNGDYNGVKAAHIRAQESVNALSLLGVRKEDVFFMGYADTGFQAQTSFLFKLYDSHDLYRTYVAPYSIMTYHPLSVKTIHQIAFDKEGLYCKHCFIKDLEAVFSFLKPQLLLVPSYYDHHYDHKALSLFIQEFLIEKEITIPVYSYLVHSGNDLLWPNRENLYFTCPPQISNTFWQNRIVYRFSRKDAEWKKQLIQSFASQSPLSNNGFLLSFAKKEEFYFQEMYYLR
jgi:LmbE family N-acetylglucosaminyl deacetylase